MLSILEQYDAIIFDMDGTLLDSMPSHMEAWRLASEEFNIPYDHQWHCSLGGVPTLQTSQRVMERYGLELDPAQVATRKQQIWEQMEARPALIPETYEVFTHFIDQKPIGVGTGAERSHALQCLGHVGVLNRLGALITACDVSQGKPHPETFLETAKALAVEPSNCVVFEDTEIGRQAAVAAGMSCILVLEGEIQWPKRR